MGVPVISLRHGRNNIIWVHQLPDHSAPRAPRSPAPRGPGAYPARGRSAGP